jgi:hypothetical protein
MIGGVLFYFIFSLLTADERISCALRARTLAMLVNLLPPCFFFFFSTGRTLLPDRVSFHSLRLEEFSLFSSISSKNIIL